MFEPGYAVLALAIAGGCVVLTRRFFTRRFLFVAWSVLSFAGLVASNILVTPPDKDANLARPLVGVLAVALLVSGLFFAAEAS